MPSFDIVSKTDLNEVENALNNVRREIETRYDFKGSNCTIDRKENVLTVFADDDLKLRQMHELLQGHLTRRNVDAGVLDYKTPEQAAGQSVRQQVIVREGIEKDLAKKLVKEIKGSKIKVQVAIQGDELRVTGKKRDDLQEVITFCKSLDFEMPLQYINFRD
ncbi:YajQ family cyclic di-GMP-binding protein [Sneathiella aquimaris]|uniref:YajQ family cyclic di-GMP-binding protein n=1 Tax=Sneathiella aquimaris TaxID=2599305 RepID=UPI00146F8E26|nr:YajQ family cyclic di-GMP-binding protein [Sneathiella aquimaris]